MWSALCYGGSTTVIRSTDCFVHNFRDAALITLCVSSAARYHWRMIRSFRGKDTEVIWQRRYVKLVSPELARLTYNKPVLINAAETINDLRVPPGNRLEKLTGARAGQYSIRVNDQWRICFIWSAAGAGNVELVDYH